MVSLRSWLSAVDLCQGQNKVNNSKTRRELKVAGSSASEIIEMIENQVIGGKTVLHGPFGPRRVVYLDHTASGKSLKCIEAFIEKEVLPFYGNTHTAASATGRQTTAYRDEARQIVHKSVDADSDDTVIFYGSGTTACIHKLVHSLSLSGPSGKGDKAGMEPIAFVGPYEHHSNLLPWREAGVKVVNIPPDKYGLLDMDFLEKTLSEISKQKVNRGRLLLGCFSAGSNVTGALSDDIALTILMHKYGGYAFFDYAAAGPHVKISMNPQLKNKKLRALARKDAIYFSGHKFVGGPQTTGGCAGSQKSCVRNEVPHGCGGGTVFFVTPSNHAYVQDIAEREEGGTPAIVSSIRLGLVFKLRATIGEEEIIARESFYTRRALRRWAKIPGIILLGNTDAPRLPIISFLIQHISTGSYLHYNFVVSLLNDLFGIQSRGGCMCAGPYAQNLLGIDQTLAEEFQAILSKPRVRMDADGKPETYYDAIFRPGFTRISFPYHAPLEEIDFVIEAVGFVAKHGWKFLPLYTMSTANGSFLHRMDTGQLNSVASMVFTSNGLEGTRSRKNKSFVTSSVPNYRKCLELAHQKVETMQGYNFQDYRPDLSPDSESLRWFLLPSEAVAHAYRISVKPSPRPFTIPDIPDSRQGKAFRTTETGSIPGQYLASGWMSTKADEKMEKYLQNRTIQLKHDERFVVDDSEDDDETSCSRPIPELLGTVLNSGTSSYDSGVEGQNSIVTGKSPGPGLRHDRHGLRNLSRSQFPVQSIPHIWSKDERDLRDFPSLHSLYRTSTASEFDTKTYDRTPWKFGHRMRY